VVDVVELVAGSSVVVVVGDEVVGDEVVGDEVVGDEVVVEELEVVEVEVDEALVTTVASVIRRRAAVVAVVDDVDAPT